MGLVCIGMSRKTLAVTHENQVSGFEDRKERVIVMVYRNLAGVKYVEITKTRNCIH